MSTSVRAVLFDAVGTLIYTDPPPAHVYYSAGCRHGSTLSFSQIEAGFGRAMIQHMSVDRTDEESERLRWSNVVDSVFSDMDDTSRLFEELWSHFAEHRHWVVFDDVSGVWEELESRGLIVAVASNFDQRLLEISSQLSPLNRARSIFVSSQLGYAKPHVEFFRAIEQSLKLRPEELLMVGDHKGNDFEGASQAGWHSLLVDRGGSSECESIVGSLAELLRRLS